MAATIAPAAPTSADPTLLYTGINSIRPLFENVTAKAGVQANDSLLSEATLMRERDNGFMNGGRGACVADFDNDGDDDIYVNGPGLNQLFRNDGNFTFVDVSQASGARDSGYGMGCAAGDLDNDGDEDMVVTNWYSTFTIYRNDGNMTFSNMTADSGVTDAGPEAGVALGDFDSDGRLDFIIAEYNKVNDKIYRNDGDFKFTDKTTDSSISDTDYGFQPIAADYDRDGDLDVYIVNDFGVDTLWENQGHFQFFDVSLSTRANDPGSGMGGAWADFDDDGDLDVYVTNFNENGLWENQGATFVNVANDSGVDDNWIGWGVAWLDYDNDGHMDLYVGNGHVESARAWNQPSKLFHNQGNRTFADVSIGSGAMNGEVARGLATGDFNQDGMTDLYILNVNCGAMLLKNVVQNNNTWLRIKLEGTRSNRDGVGALVSVVYGNHSTFQVVSAGSSYLSSVSRVLNFGLADVSVATEVDVQWPSGLRQVVKNVAVNQTLVITEADDKDPNAVAGDIAVRQGERFVLNGSSSSDNVRVVNWTWTIGMNGTNKTAWGMVSPMTLYVPGVFPGRLEVRDLFGRVGVATFQVTVQPYKAAWVDVGPDFSVPEGANVSFQATGGSTATPDFETDCTIEWWFDTATGRVTLWGVKPWFVFDDPGLFRVFVKVTDPQNATGTDSVNVTVRDAKVPVVVATVPTNVDEDTVVRLDASRSSDNDPTFPASGTFFWNYSGAHGPVSWSGMSVDAVFADPGVFTLRLEASDPAGNVVVQIFTVVVRDTTSPVPNAGPDRTTLPERDVAFTASAATDNDATFQQTGRFEWTIHLHSGPLVLSGQSVVYAFEYPGTFQVDLDVWDQAGNHALAVDSAVVVVEDIVSPVPFGGGDRTLGVLDLIIFDASGTTDNDPTILETGTFVWEFQDGSARVSLSGPVTNFTFSRAGAYTVRLTVRDAGGNAAALTFKVTVADLDPPSISMAELPLQIFSGAPLELNATGTTDNVGVASITWRVRGPFAFDTQLYTSTGVVVMTLLGNYTVTLTAKDAAGNAATESRPVSVIARPSGGPDPTPITDPPDNGTTDPPEPIEPRPEQPGPSAPALGGPALLAAISLAAFVMAVRRRRAS